MSCLVLAVLALLPWGAGIAAYAWTGSPYMGMAGFASGMIVMMTTGSSWVRYRQDKSRMGRAVDTSARIRAVSDPLIEYGYTPGQVQDAVLHALGIRIGGGTAGTADTVYPGPLPDLLACPYCGAAGGGSHGELCPNGGPGG